MCVCVARWGGGVCGVGVAGRGVRVCVCVRARVRVGMHVVCGHACGVWAEAERHIQAKDNAVCVWGCGCGVKGPACGRGVCVVWAAWVCVCVCGVRLWVQGQRQRPRDTARQRTTQCVCWGGGEGVVGVGGVWPV